MFDAPDRIVEIDILAFPETTVILLASVIEPLRAANRIAGRQLYGWRLLSLDGRPVETTAGIDIPVDGAFRPGHEQNPLFLVSSYNWRRNNTTSLKMALSRAARHRSMIAGVESGTWLMAEASLLDNHRVTVHWEDLEDFSARYPQIDVVNERFGWIATWMVILSCAISAGNAFVRYGISYSSNAFLEIQWYMFGAM